MAHPIGNQYRSDKQEHSRVSRITKACGGGMASGGGTHSDEAADKALVRKMVKGTALRASGGAVKARADRPARARGGRLGAKKGTKGNVVNVIIAGGGQPKTPMVPGVPSPVAPLSAPRPAPLAPPPSGGPGAPTPGSPPMGGGPLPPGVLPMRKAGGRVPMPRPDPRTPRKPQPGDLYEPEQVKQLEDQAKRARGGKVESSNPKTAFTARKVDKRGSQSTAEGAGIGKGRTPPQPAPMKDEVAQVGRKAVITKATGGPIDSSRGPMAPHAKGGAMGGLAKLDKAHNPRKYTKA